MSPSRIGDIFNKVRVFYGYINLIKLGVPERLAISIGLSSKGYYRLAKTKAMQMGLSNRRLKQQGLVSLKDQWVKCRYPNG